MQQLAPRPSQPPRPIPYGLVSLWDMLQFHADKYVNLMYWLTHMELVYGHTDRQGRSRLHFEIVPEPGVPPWSSQSRWTKTSKLRHGPFDKDNLQTVKTMATKCLEHCARFNLNGTEEALRRVIREINGYRPTNANFASILEHAFDECMRRLQEDLERHVFVALPQDRVASYKAKSPLGAKASIAFSRAKRDAIEARRCYALEAHDASIYHSMMVLEIGLPAFAKRFGVKIKPRKSTWGPIIDRIEDRIRTQLRAMGNTPPGRRSLSTRAAQKRWAFLEAAQDAALHFSHFKNVWRDHIAHGRAGYDRHAALKVLEHVEPFMQVLATKLELKQVRIT